MPTRSLLCSLLIAGLLSAILVLPAAETHSPAPVSSILTSNQDTVLEANCSERGHSSRLRMPGTSAEDETVTVSVSAPVVAERLQEDPFGPGPAGLWGPGPFSALLIGLFVTGLLETIYRESEAQKSQVQEREATAEAILKTTTDGIFTMDTEGTIKAFDKTAERIFGYEAEEVIGKRAEQLFVSFPYRGESDEQPPSFHDRDRRSLIGAGPAVTGKHKDGSTFPMYLAVRRVEVADRTIIVGIARDVSERRRLEKEMLSISEQVRRQVGRNLHDGIASQLAVAGIRLDTLARRAEEEGISGEEIAGRIRKARQLVAESAEEVRRLSHGLNPVDFSDEQLPAALARLADNTEKARFVIESQSGDECREVEIEEEDEVPEWDALPRLEDETAKNLYWIAQEAITNAHKHADADEIVIRLEAKEEALLLSVEDDGKGLPLSEVDDEGFGLRSVKYRARVLGATLSLDSAPGEGTRLSCRLPLGSRESQADERPS